MEYLASPYIWQNGFVALFILFVGALLGAFAWAAYFDWYDRHLAKQSARRRELREIEATSAKSLRPMPDLIVMGVYRWLCETDPNTYGHTHPADLHGSPNSPIYRIGIATLADSASDDLAGRWYCNICYELSDWADLQDLLGTFSDIATVESMYTDSDLGVVQLYFRIATREGIKSFTPAPEVA